MKVVQKGIRFSDADLEKLQDLLVLSMLMIFLCGQQLDSSIGECVWAKDGPRFGQSKDIRRVFVFLPWLHVHH